MAAPVNMVHCQLWMGGLEPYMTESFILSSFQRMGEKPLNVKVMRNKYTGEPAGYCFVHFENDDEAIDAMHKLNGKIIPNTNPAVRFRLNTASNQGKIMINEREFSLWVGDLSSEVDDYTLFKCFSAKYQSIKAAKVILDASGYSKGFGFLRFGHEEEQKHCLTHMNGYKGLGSKPLKISNAIPKSQRTSNSNGPPMSQPSSGGGGGYQYPPDYSPYYDPNYWQNYGQWGGYGYDPNTGNYNYDPSSYATQYPGQYPGQYNQYPPPSTQYPQQNYAYPHPPYPAYYPPQTTPAGSTPAASSVPTAAPPTTTTSSSTVVDDSNEVVEHSTPVEVEKENREYSDAILNFWLDVTSNGGVIQEVFDEEIEKLNIMEVSIPPVTVKLENKLQAKRAIEAQGMSNPLESEGSEEGSREGSEEPEAKKMKLLADSSEEADKEGDVDMAEVKQEIKEERDLDVSKVTTKNELGEEEVKDESEEKPFVALKEEEPEDIEAKERSREEWDRVAGFMAMVDIDIMMTETERVSSEESSDDESERGVAKSDKESSSEGESDEGSGRISESRIKIKDLDQMETMETDAGEPTSFKVGKNEKSSKRNETDGMMSSKVNAEEKLQPDGRGAEVTVPEEVDRLESVQEKDVSTSHIVPETVESSTSSRRKAIGQEATPVESKRQKKIAESSSSAKGEDVERMQTDLPQDYEETKTDTLTLSSNEHSPDNRRADNVSNTPPALVEECISSNENSLDDEPLSSRLTEGQVDSTNSTDRLTEQIEINECSSSLNNSLEDKDTFDPLVVAVDENNSSNSSEVEETAEEKANWSESADLLNGDEEEDQTHLNKTSPASSAENSDQEEEESDDDL